MKPWRIALDSVAPSIVVKLEWRLLDLVEAPLGRDESPIYEEAIDYFVHYMIETNSTLPIITASKAGAIVAYWRNRPNEWILEFRANGAVFYTPRDYDSFRTTGIMFDALLSEGRHLIPEWTLLPGPSDAKKE